MMLLDFQVLLSLFDFLGYHVGTSSGCIFPIAKGWWEPEVATQEGPFLQTLQLWCFRDCLERRNGRRTLYGHGIRGPAGSQPKGSGPPLQGLGPKKARNFQRAHPCQTIRVTNLNFAPGGRGMLSGY